MRSLVALIPTKLAAAIFCIAIFFCNGLSELEITHCPSYPGDLSASVILFTLEGDTGWRRAVFAKSRLGQLCTLVRVSTEGTSIAPIARSYDGYDWEASAGEYASLKFSCQNWTFTNGEDEPICNATLPPLQDGQQYVVKTFHHALTEEQTTARFLESASFGPTRDALKTFGHDIAGSNNSSLLKPFAQWIDEQIRQVKGTSHREYYRRRINPRWPDAESVARSNFPCDRLSRWRKYAFDPLDRKKRIDVAGDGPFVLSIGGYVRTVVEDMRFRSTVDYQLADGNAYEICGDLKEEFVGGKFKLRMPDGNCVSSKGGNPPVNFRIDVEGGMPHHVISVPHTVDSQQFIIVDEGPSLGDAFLFNSTQGMSDPYCDLLPSSGREWAPPVFGLTSDGTWLQHDPRIVLQQNSIEHPLFDGGGFTSLHTGGTVLCSNAPRSFLNERSCRVSFDASACGPSLLQNNAEKPLNIPTLLMLHNLTGRYIYAIDGLPTEVGAVESPCKPGSRSRWKRTQDSQCPSEWNISQASSDNAGSETLKHLLQASEDENPFIRDVYMPKLGVACSGVNLTIGVTIALDDGSCYELVHPDYLSVYDFTYWTRSDTHPGNMAAQVAGRPNPIKGVAEKMETHLTFPSWHPITRWETTRQYFTYVGRFGDDVRFIELPDDLRLETVGEIFGAIGTTSNHSDGGVFVCGSAGEVANDPTNGEGFDSRDMEVFAVSSSTTTKDEFLQQKKTVWTMTALTAPDQLRQRMAWALSQIFAVSIESLNIFTYHTEIHLAYFDIFVRHAFGNFRDVLKEVSYSPIMARMLTFLDSKSSAHTWDKLNQISYPDENFAREIMQLFTIGLVELDTNGVPVTTEEGSTIPTYDNDDILSYSRAWTGFAKQPTQRGNVETGSSKYLDPLRIVPSWRDRFPKTSLKADGYIGDGYPLCEDLPERAFLRKGAKYRRLMTPLAEMQENPEYGEELGALFVLDATSSLYQALCGQPLSDSDCTFPNSVELTSNVPCTTDDECNLDKVRVLQLNEHIFYEYIRVPCVQTAFYNDALKITEFRHSKLSFMCANPRTDVASEACCQETTEKVAYRNCNYFGERMTFARAEQRCQFIDKTTCDFQRFSQLSCGDCCAHRSHEDFFWTDAPCNVKAKVDSDGRIAIVHDVGASQPEQDIVGYLRSDSQNFFRVNWGEGSFPSVANGCGNGACDAVIDGCLCNTFVFESAVFTDMPSSQDVLSKLHIGSAEPGVYDEDTYELSGEGDNVKVYSRVNGNTYDTETIFQVSDEATGRLMHLKNIAYTVHVRKASGEVTPFAFRNPPHFMSFTSADLRDAQYETEAVLDSYFYHRNTAPFLALRFIQRFGISNPSPRYIEAVAIAFRRGAFVCSDSCGVDHEVSFGAGDYGDLAATIAAVLLDREARSVVLDADPAHGSLREPLLKVVAFLRAMEYVPDDDMPLIQLRNVRSSIGQMAHETPSVFSFFLPEYKPPGPLTRASLVAPEAQVLSTPTVVGTLNALFSLIKYGLSSCDYGLGVETPGECTGLEGNYEKSVGRLSYAPSSPNPEAVVAELSTLLTSGRLSSENRMIIRDAYESRLDDAAALRMALQLVSTTAEFHTTNIVAKSGGEREVIAQPTTSDREYKAVVYLLLDGGCDSFNMIVPVSGCDQKDLYEEYREIRDILALQKESLHLINVTNQPCQTFGVHPELEILQELYNEESLLFLANTGTLTRPVNKANYEDATKTKLFAHNTQVEEVQRIDPYDTTAGTGVLGRMNEVLTRNGFQTGSYSVERTSVSLVGRPGGHAPAVNVVGKTGVSKFNPNPTSDEMRQTIEGLNSGTTAESGLFGETWSSALHQALAQNEVLFNALETSIAKNEFPRSDLGESLEVVSRLIGAHKDLGHDRDVFFVSYDGFDTHLENKEKLRKRFKVVNDAVKAFVKEMKDQELWENVVMVETSDFGRTLTPNSSDGSDHGWGGNYFVLGGDVDGGQVLGSYPSDLTELGELNIGRGRLIPETPWDSVWVAISQWMGVDADLDLNEVLPNRHNFAGRLFDQADLFIPPPTASPSVSPSESRAPTAMPTGAPSQVPSAMPSLSPSSLPTVSAMPSESASPSGEPSGLPSQWRSNTPSMLPSQIPSSLPTETPSILPSSSTRPSGTPSTFPSSSVLPSSAASLQPSISTKPTLSPSVGPSLSEAPSIDPSSEPSIVASVNPSRAPLFPSTSSTDMVTTESWGDGDNYRIRSICGDATAMDEEPLQSYIHFRYSIKTTSGTNVDELLPLLERTLHEELVQGNLDCDSRSHHSGPRVAQVDSPLGAIAPLGFDSSPSAEIHRAQCTASEDPVIDRDCHEIRDGFLVLLDGAAQTSDAQQHYTKFTEILIVHQRLLRAHPNITGFFFLGTRLDEDQAAEQVSTSNDSGGNSFSGLQIMYVLLASCVSVIVGAIALRRWKEAQRWRKWRNLDDEEETDKYFSATGKGEESWPQSSRPMTPAFTPQSDEEETSLSNFTEIDSCATGFEVISMRSGGSDRLSAGRGRKAESAPPRH